MNIFGGHDSSWTFVVNSDYITQIERFMKENRINFTQLTSCTTYKNDTVAVYTVTSRDTLFPTITVILEEIAHLEVNG